MSLSDTLTDLEAQANQAKQDLENIREALEEKGVDTPVFMWLSDVPNLIKQVPSIDPSTYKK